MSGFVATAPTAGDPENDILANDGWFPDLSLDAVRKAVRIDGSITHERLLEVALYAVSNINDRLESFKHRHETAGVSSLGDVSTRELGGERRLVLLYRRAVHSTIKADLIERYRDYDSTDSGLRRAEELDPAADEQRRNATWAVRDILGETHSIVELI